MSDQIPLEQRATTPEQPPSRFAAVLPSILGGGAVMSVLAVLVALVVGAVLIALTDQKVQAAAGYFMARPTDTLGAIWAAVSGGYLALFQGGVYNYLDPTFAGGIAPLLNSIGFATPLIAAGLGIGLGFRAGMFNIGGQGQMLIGGAFGGLVGFALPLPPGIHIIVAVLAALVGGAVWGGIVGVLKARTGANEVIVTIMLNYIAFYLIDYLLHTPVLQKAGSSDPKTPAELPTAIFPPLFGPQYSLNLGFILVIIATIVTWWILGRSSLGFKFRAVGLNPKAATVAGINVKRMYIYVMAISGALVGFAGVYQVLGQVTTGFTNAFDAGIGFNAITVALLGRSRPWGVFGAGILFGIFQSGGYTMQAAQGIDIDIVTVIQSIVVLFIAAPPLVRAIFRLPTPGAPRASRKRQGSSGPDATTPSDPTSPSELTSKEAIAK
jgi:ABC-type uncharacterized transport system permease subunit